MSFHCCCVAMPTQHCIIEHLSPGVVLSSLKSSPTLHPLRLYLDLCIYRPPQIPSNPHKDEIYHQLSRYVHHFLIIFLVHMALFPLFPLCPLFQGNPRRRQWTTRPSASWSRTVGRGRVEDLERSRNLKHSETQRNTI